MKKSSIKNILYGILRLSCGIILAFAGLAKMFSLDPFAQEISSLSETIGLSIIVGPAGTAMLIAIILSTLEFLVGSLLISGKWMERVLPATTVLIFGFLIVNFYRIIAGSDGSCHCFGQFAETTYSEILILDFLMLFAVLALLANQASSNNSYHNKEKSIEHVQ